MDMDKVREVRSRSNVSLSACKRVLEQAGGDVEAALVLLKKQGLIKAAETAGRLATSGKIHVYLHAGGSKAALVEINCETDFAANTPEFQEFCDVVGMQIVGMSPTYVSQEDVPNVVTGQQLDIFFQQTPPNKPDEFRAKIAAGKLEKWYGEVCLLNQACAEFPNMTIDQLRLELVAKIGENVNIRRFIRWEVGEGLEPKRDNFAAEVENLSGVDAGVLGNDSTMHHIALSQGDCVK